MARFIPFLIILCFSPLSAQVEGALHMDNFDQSIWSNGPRELFFETVTSKSQKEKPYYRYRLKTGENTEYGISALRFGWREEQAHMVDGAPLTNYFYHLILTPDRKTPRTVLIRMEFFGRNASPVGFTEEKTGARWSLKKKYVNIQI